MGEDEPGACQLHRTMYNMLERHVMRTTAAQFVWQPKDTEGEEDRVNSGAASSAEHRPENQQVEGGETTGQIPRRLFEHESESATSPRREGTRRRLDR